MSGRCPCTGLIQPWRDGLLDQPQGTLLEQHLREGCDPCQQELLYLDWLVHSLRALTPMVDEVALQRRRAPLVLRATQQPLPETWPVERRSALYKIALAAAAAVALTVLVLDRSPQVRVTRISGTGEIQRFTEGEHSILQLSDGRYELHVSRGMLDRALLVRLPDGEIEDLGTVFGITVNEGRTSAVEVREGAVQLRLQGTPQLTLGAGASWQSPTDAAPRSAPETAATPVQPSLPSPAVSRGGTDARPAAALRPAAIKHSASHRSANNTEDAMYLRMLDLLRADRRDAARNLAQRYLKQFPHGFRRAEVLRISRTSEPSELPPKQPKTSY